MIIHYHVDRCWKELRDTSPGVPGERGALPRRTVYGDAPGLIPFGEAYPDKLVDPKDFKEVIRVCHEKQIFPVYHQHATWAPPGFKWDQNGLSYCWTWGGAAGLMDCRAREGRPTVILSPVTMGWLVNWRNTGNYLDSWMKGATERGIAPMEYTPDPLSLNYRSYKAGWEEAALQYRLAEAWDTDKATMLQHALSVLATGTPLYIAYDWWGHALQCCGLRWDETVKDSVVWQIRNSHNEDDIIEMSGARAVPDEAYGIRATLTEL